MSATTRQLEIRLSLAEERSELVARALAELQEKFARLVGEHAVIKAQLTPSLRLVAEQGGQQNLQRLLDMVADAEGAPTNGASMVGGLPVREAPPEGS